MPSLISSFARVFKSPDSLSGKNVLSSVLQFRQASCHLAPLSAAEAVSQQRCHSWQTPSDWLHLRVTRHTDQQLHTSMAANDSQLEVDQLTASWAKIEELVDGLRDLMGAIMVGNDSKYDYAAATIAMRLYQIREHAKLARKLSFSIQMRRAQLLGSQQHSQPQAPEAKPAAVRDPQPAPAPSQRNSPTKSQARPSAATQPAPEPARPHAAMAAATEATAAAPPRQPGAAAVGSAPASQHGEQQRPAGGTGAGGMASPRLPPRPSSTSVVDLTSPAKTKAAIAHQRGSHKQAPNNKRQRLDDAATTSSKPG